MLYPKETWTHQGTVGHFIFGRLCQFHLTTVVGPWLISTVGEYFPDAPTRENLSKSRGVSLIGLDDARRDDYMQKIGFEDVGFERKYETIVFPAGESHGCSCSVASDFSEHEMRGYNDHDAANHGHLELCIKYADIPG